MSEIEALTDFERVGWALRAAGASDYLNMSVAFDPEHRDLHAYLCSLTDPELGLAALLVASGHELEDIRRTVDAALADESEA